MCTEFVFSLDATDEFLKERVLNLPENVVRGTSHSFDKFLPRLVMFRKCNAEEETVLNYFDELEIHPERMGRPPFSMLTNHATCILKYICIHDMCIVHIDV